MYYFIPNDFDPCIICDNVPGTLLEEPTFRFFKSIDILMNRFIVAKVGVNWLGGEITRTYNLFESNCEITKLSDVPDIDNFLSLGEFMKQNGIHPDTKEYILKNFRIDIMYIKKDK